MTHPRPSLPQGQLLYMQVRVMTILPAARIVGPKNARKRGPEGLKIGGLSHALAGPELVLL